MGLVYKGSEAQYGWYTKWDIICLVYRGNRTQWGHYTKGVGRSGTDIQREKDIMGQGHTRSALP